MPSYLERDIQNLKEGMGPLEKRPVFSNIQFDANGVVIYDASSPTYDSEKEVVNVPPKVEKIDNPFVQNMKSTNEVINKNSNEWSIFKNIQFDENGIVISAEEYTPKELNDKE